MSELPSSDALDVASPSADAHKGRNVPWAIGIGLGLLAAMALVALLSPLLMLVVVILGGAAGSREVLQGLRNRAIPVPALPVYSAAVILPLATFVGGAEALLGALLACVVIVFLWRSFDGRPGASKVIAASSFLILWVPFLLSFSFLLLWFGGKSPSFALFELPPSWGALHMVALLMIVAGTDTFAYAVGARWGKTPLAPRLSPKKTWEGFLGSIGGSAVGGILAAQFVPESWAVLVVVVPIAVAATVGDLAESFVKRQLKVKDMSSVLPGHGGIMDRMDSLLFALPVGVAGFWVLEWMNM